MSETIDLDKHGLQDVDEAIQKFFPVLSADDFIDYINANCALPEPIVSITYNLADYSADFLFRIKGPTGPYSSGVYIRLYSNCEVKCYKVVNGTRIKLDCLTRLEIKLEYLLKDRLNTCDENPFLGA